MTIEIDALKILPEEEARAGKLAVFPEGWAKTQVAIESPNPETTQRILRSLKEKGLINKHFSGFRRKPLARLEEVQPKCPNTKKPCGAS